MGELAALATSLFWTFTSISFTIAGREVGSPIVNRSRLVLAVIFLSLTHWAMQGSLFPVGVDAHRWLWLSISGVIGLVVGDAFLFQAFVMVGARISMLLMVLVPVFGTILAWVFLGETLSAWQLGAIALTVSGVVWVVMERVDSPTESDPKYHFQGIMYGIAGALGQALGLVAAKEGLAGDFPIISGVLIRMIVAALFIWLFTALRGKLGESTAILKNKKALKATIFGSAVGPFLGVWMSLIAVRLAPVGIASTLMALTPIFVLPIAHYIMKERVSPRAVFGTVVALVGVAIIFMV